MSPCTTHYHCDELLRWFGPRAFGCQCGIHGHRTRLNAIRPNVVALGPNQAKSALWCSIRNAFWHCILREFEPMSPNPAPFVARRITIEYIAACNPQHPVANVIVDGSSPFTRSLTTADSKCQPLFILRTGRELGRLGFVCWARSFCQFLTANAYPRLTFGTISGPGAVFLAPNLALEN